VSEISGRKSPLQGVRIFHIVTLAALLIYSHRSLLISLAIFRSLATECRRDIALLSPSLIASVDATLSAVPTDLEIVTRAASVVCFLYHVTSHFLNGCWQFTAWTTYTDGHLIGTDSNLTRDYLLVLNHFASLSSSSAADEEIKNRSEHTLVLLCQTYPKMSLALV
jgi:protein EFR3